MKIKTDFVTNSSSSCYVVFVPNSFSVKDKMIEQAIQGEKNNRDIDNIKKEVSECLESLKEGNNIYNDSYVNGRDHQTYMIVYNILENQGFGIKLVDFSSIGMECIVGIPEEKVVKIIVDNADITSFIKVRKHE